MELIERCIIGINTATQVISEKISHLCHSSTFSNSLTTKSFVLYLAKDCALASASVGVHVYACNMLA